jgi:replicative DNA helicase
MEVLKGIHISSASEEGLKEIEERKLGLRSKGLKIGFPMLEECMGGGLQKTYAYLLPALSGHGKSTMLNIIETAVVEQNPDEDVMVLNFNFETPSHMNLIKKYSSDTDRTVDELLSVNEDLDDTTLDKVKYKAEKYKDYPIYYFDVSGTPRAISNTIMAAHLKYPDKHLVCFLDHSGLLTPSSGNQRDIELADEFAKMVIDTKKQAKCSWFILGQLNSEIESMERLKNPQFHAPKKGDLYGSKLTWNAMDVVVMMHKPEKLDLASYTTRELPTIDRMYFHIRKQRYGEEPTIMMDCSKIGQNILTELEIIK